MHDRRMIKSYLEKVRTSQCFAKSTVLKELFVYLVTQYLLGETPSEMELAFEIFGRKHQVDKEKNIRIYVFNLRKKLKVYYENEGAHDALCFSIPKGAYEVHIDYNKSEIIRSMMIRFAPICLVVGLLLSLSSVYLFYRKTRPEICKSFLWEPTYLSSKPLMIVLGDHYFVNAKNKFGRNGCTRYTEINSDKDLENYIIANPRTEEILSKTTSTYINRQAPYCLYKVMRFLGNREAEISMRYSSTLEFEHLKGVNTLFIGSYKSQNCLKELFHQLGISFNVNSSILSYDLSDTTYRFNPKSDEFLMKEYASVLHFKTSDDRSVIALLCNTDMGNISTVKYLSIPANIKKLRSLTSSFPNDNFKAIFEVRGQEQTDFQIQLKRIDPIVENINQIWP